jgi:WhiB family redox-sensing transcriptional regulator
MILGSEYHVSPRAAGLFDVADSERWMADGVCAQIGGDLWHPEKGKAAKPAKMICHTCPVEQQCLEFALLHDERGVWGGMSERERRKIKGQTGRAA